MLTRARSLFSRVFSLDTPSSQIRLDDVVDDIGDDTSDDNDIDNVVDDDIDNSTNGVDNDDDDDDEDDGLSDSDNDWSNESRQASTTNTKIKGKYERQINEFPSNSAATSKTKSNMNYARSHEKSKQNRLLSAMQVATSRCNVESMKKLLNNFEIDINHRDQYGMSYLEHAILMGSFDMVNLLVRYGCDLYQGDSSGHSYLYVAIETTTNKSLPIIRLLLETNCACLRLMDIVSLTAPQQLIYINSQDFLLLNAHLLFILKYHMRRMVLSDVLNLVTYLITTNILLCKNDEHYGLSSCTKTALNRFNNDYVHLFVKTLGAKHALKLEHKLNNLQTSVPSSTLIPLVHDNVQPYVNRINELVKQIPELKHLCRLLIRQNLKNLKSSTLESVSLSVKLQDYLLYTPI
ncbi:unnamed protein product [Rotaria magnacalcarata]|uniref:SOCS box domain-containing protein n=5 Tax=Rotaria magnacalcarata TaxID=392030 RepID=A0A816W4J6_9BILA|nr:unnamed protein product [Rotaria magnacalcarata]CAF2056637.1 unnamed protein product [Rotaria magnacalcarata]CAF2114961.1 unnamed protein product [Rotaria magnacalcarata]CAF2121182.1 unnamed protein product [Rotaria magnacalcarata]CAF4048461.1 unnamed protein product [Rotaria magnacalcarata]